MAPSATPASASVASGASTSPPLQTSRLPAAGSPEASSSWSKSGMSTPTGCVAGSTRSTRLPAPTTVTRLNEEVPEIPNASLTSPCSAVPGSRRGGTVAWR
jgi:hypothetical protein